MKLFLACEFYSSAIKLTLFPVANGISAAFNAANSPSRGETRQRDARHAPMQLWQLREYATSCSAAVAVYSAALFGCWLGSHDIPNQVGRLVPSVISQVCVALGRLSLFVSKQTANQRQAGTLVECDASGSVP